MNFEILPKFSNLKDEIKIKIKPDHKIPEDLKCQIKVININYY